MVNKSNKIRYIQKLITQLPDYIQEYYRSKSAQNLSTNTLYEYLKEYNHFFIWLSFTHKIEKDKIPTSLLEQLPKREVELYIASLREDKSVATLNRVIAALRSLFRYLAEEYEDENGETLISRNVMVKFPAYNQTETISARANRIKKKLYLDTETTEFLEFIENDYIETLVDKKSKKLFLKNKKRDLAIIALLLASGIRVSECVNIEVKDIVIQHQYVTVTRKGNFKDSVHFAYFAKRYIKDYIEISRSTYHPKKEDKKLFLTYYRGRANGISVSTVEKLVEKYSTAFGKPTTPHKFRHTLATRLYSETKSQLVVSTQLGHSSTRSSDIYSHIFDDTVKNALDSL